MELTWVAIAASLCMGLGAAFLFVFAVKRTGFAIWKTPSIRCSGPTSSNSWILRRSRYNGSQSPKK